MGVIPLLADHGASPKENVQVEGSGRSIEVAQPKSEKAPVMEKRLSWADECKIAEEGVQPVLEETVLIVTPDVEKIEEKVELKKVVEDKKEEQVQKAWADVVRGNRIAGNGLELEYVRSGEEVEITEDEWNEGEKIWRYPVVGKVVNSNPPYTEVLKWASVNWKKETPRVSQLKPGVFIFEFHSNEQKWDVLRKNWSFYHKYAVVFKPWDVDGEVDEKSFTSTPVWIQLPQLPPRLWTSRNLSKIVSHIGKPIATDRMTAQRSKMDYARVLVDIESLENAPSEIPISKPDGRYLRQRVLYEWKMVKCSGCGMLGHEVEKCRRRKLPTKPKDCDQEVGEGSGKLVEIDVGSSNISSKEVVNEKMAQAKIQEKEELVKGGSLNIQAKIQGEKVRDSTLRKEVSKDKMVQQQDISLQVVEKQNLKISKVGGGNGKATGDSGKKNGGKIVGPGNQGGGSIIRPPNG